MDVEKARSVVKIFLTVLLVHSFVCDGGAFALGRFTDIQWWVGLPLVIIASATVTLILEKPWKKSHHG